MRPAGALVPEQAHREAITKGVKKTLAAAHRVDIVHTDIRLANILYFDPVPGEVGSGGWQLIDFGLSTKTDSRVGIEINSSRHERCGNRIRGLEPDSMEDKIWCIWGTSDDIAMLDGLNLP